MLGHGKAFIYDAPGCVLTRWSLYSSKYVENGAVVLTDGDAEFVLSLEKVSLPFTFVLDDLFTAARKLLPPGDTTERDPYTFLEKTSSFRGVNFA